MCVYVVDWKWCCFWKILFGCLVYFLLFEKFEWFSVIGEGVGCWFFFFCLCCYWVYFCDWSGVCLFSGVGELFWLVDVIGYFWVKWSWVIVFVKNV